MLQKARSPQGAWQWGAQQPPAPGEPVPTGLTCLSPTKRCHPAVESLRVPEALEISGAGAGHGMDSEILGLLLCSRRGSCGEQGCSSRQHHSHAPRSCTAGVTGYSEKHSNCEEQDCAVQQPVPGVFPHLHYKGFRGPQSGKT